MPYKDLTRTKRASNLRAAYRHSPDHLCWICRLPVVRTRNSSSPFRQSADHILLPDGSIQIRLAHAWCNSARGAADAPVTEALRARCEKRLAQVPFFLKILRQKYGAMCQTNVDTSVSSYHSISTGIST